MRHVAPLVRGQWSNDHAGLFAREVGAEECVEAFVPICVDHALIPGQVIGGVFALAVGAELIPGAGWSLAAPGPLIADIAPEARGQGFARLAAGLQFDRGVVGEERRTCADKITDVIGQGLQEGQGTATPVG